MEARCQTLLCHGDVSLESLLGRLGGLCGAGALSSKMREFTEKSRGLRGFVWEKRAYPLSLLVNDPFPCEILPK